MGWLTDAAVNPLTTVNALKALITNSSAHADHGPMRARIVAQIDAGVADGTLTDASVAAANTVAGLAGLTQTDPGRTWGGPVD
jgi:hypothetical protein